MTQAWLKFYEILTYFPQLVEFQHPNVSSLHLCEAPGAFISALMQYCDGIDMPLPNWMAATLNPWHEQAAPGEVINFDSLILAFPDKWVFGGDNTGNIFAPDALSSLQGGVGKGSKFYQKFKIMSKIQHYFRNLKFCQQFQILSKIPNFVKNSKFCHKFNIISEI